MMLQNWPLPRMVVNLVSADATLDAFGPNLPLKHGSHPSVSNVTLAATVERGQFWDVIGQHN